MRKFGVTPRWAGLLLAVAVASPVIAQETHWYVGASAGQAKYKGACNGSPVSCKDHDTAWKLFGGYQFNQNFGAEVGYTDLGKAKLNGITSGVSVDASLAATAWELLGVGTLPLGQGFGLYGKAGLYRAETKLSATAAIPGFSASSSGKDKNSDLTFGFGGRYDITKAIGARAEWQRYRKVGGNNTDKGDINVLSVGLLFSF
jgi:OOP family OmpA-OmpF porin